MWGYNIKMPYICMYSRPAWCTVNHQQQSERVPLRPSACSPKICDCLDCTYFKLHNCLDQPPITKDDAKINWTEEERNGADGEAHWSLILRETVWQICHCPTVRRESETVDQLMHLQYQTHMCSWPKCCLLFMQCDVRCTWSHWVWLKHFRSTRQGTDLISIHV